jgi:hypothetical protein
MSDAFLKSKYRSAIMFFPSIALKIHFEFESVFYLFLVFRPAESKAYDFLSTYYFPTSLKSFFFNIWSKNPISFTYLISFSISCLPLFQISFVMSICSRFVSLQCHRMWSVRRFTAQKGHSGLGSLSITAEWVALVYPVRKRLMTTHFSCCSCSCFSFIHAIKSCWGYFSVW